MEMTSTKQRSRQKKESSSLELNTLPSFLPSIKLCFTAKTAGVHVSLDWKVFDHDHPLYPGLYIKLTFTPNIYYPLPIMHPPARSHTLALSLSKEKHKEQRKSDPKGVM